MRLRVALVAAAVSLALPAVASAETFCVNKSPCLFGTSKSTVQGALDAAEQNPGLDVVRIGAKFRPLAVLRLTPAPASIASASRAPCGSAPTG